MANSVNTSTNLWTLDTSDILTTIPICVRKVALVTSAAADTAWFYTLPGGKDATASNSGRYTIDVTNTATITDTATGAAWGATEAIIGDWVLIENCSTTANDGWYYLSATSTSSAFTIENGTNALTNSTGQTATISIYTPVVSMKITSDTYPSSTATSTPLHHPTVDWGDKGRWFDNLSFKTADTVDCELYIK